MPCRGKNILVGVVAKAKVGELEDEVREGFTRRLRKALSGVLQGVSGKRRFLVRFQDGYEKDLTSNQLTLVTVDKIPVTEEAKVPTISVIPDETVDIEKGYYNGVYVLLQFNKEDGVNRRGAQVDRETDPDEEDTEDVRPDYE